MFKDKNSQLCRLCLKSGDCPIDIFDPKGTNGYLVWKIIKEFTEIETCHSDGLPPTICEDCMKKLMDFKYFKKMCIDSRMEFLLHEINNGLVVPMTEDESGPSGGDLRGQGDDHTRDTRNNLEAEGIQSEVPIKMEEVDLSEETENVLPNNSWEFMEDEHSELADVESQELINMELSELTENVSPGNSQNSMTYEHLQPCDVKSEMCMTSERDAFEAPPPEEAASIRDANCSSEEVHRSDVHGGESVMHMKNENDQEIPPAEEYLSTSGKKSSFEGVQCSDAHGSMSEHLEIVLKLQQVPLTAELMDKDGLHHYLSSDNSDQTSVVEDCSANITGPETEVKNLSFGDVIRETVFGGGESVGNREETPEGEKDLKGLKDPERHFSARLKHGAKVPVATRSHLKQRIFSSNCRNENYGSNEGIESTLQSTSGKLIGEENGEHIKRKEETRRESRHGNGGHAGNILIGSSVGDAKSEGQDFMCDECGKAFGSKDLIERHLKVPCGRELIDCGIQGKKFHNRNENKGHKSLHCRHNISRRRVQRGVAVDVRGESEGKRQIEKRILHTCHICKKNFSQRGNLSVHIKTVHLKERKFSCGICGKAFCLKQQLQSHMRSHSGVKPYTCGHCEKGFTESGNLRKHVRAVHEMEKRHTCGECGKAFSMKQNLMKHILIHTGERPHTCDICSRSFSQKQNLQSHMLMHTGEKPHACTLCSKTFRHNISLKRHMATHARKIPHQ